MERPRSYSSRRATNCAANLFRAPNLYIHCKLRYWTYSSYTLQSVSHTMADALKAEGNKLFAEKKFAESM
jgi:hypothetical protein